MARRKSLLDVAFSAESIKSSVDDQLLFWWNRLSRYKVSPLCGSFDTFKAWALENGFREDCTIRKRVPNKAWGPDNCMIEFPDTVCEHETAQGKFSLAQERDFCRLWNKTVNRIRKHFGLPLFKEEPDDE